MKRRAYNSWIKQYRLQRIVAVIRVQVLQEHDRTTGHDSTCVVMWRKLKDRDAVRPLNLLSAAPSRRLSRIDLAVEPTRVKWFVDNALANQRLFQWYHIAYWP